MNERPPAKCPLCDQEVPTRDTITKLWASRSDLLEVQTLAQRFFRHDPRLRKRRVPLELDERLPLAARRLTSRWAKSLGSLVRSETAVEIERAPMYRGYLVHVYFDYAKGALP